VEEVITGVKYKSVLLALAGTEPADTDEDIEWLSTKWLTQA